MEDSLVDVSGYSIMRQDRNLQGGGVALYVRDGIKVKELASSNTEVEGKPKTPEFIFYEIRVGKSLPVLVAVIYRPPGVPFLKKTPLQGVLRRLSSEYSHKIIMGDFNANLLKLEGEGERVRRLASELSLRIAQHGATNTTRRASTWIDIMMIDESDFASDISN